MEHLTKVPLVEDKWLMKGRNCAHIHRLYNSIEAMIGFIQFAYLWERANP
jgi:hypothetical protein